MQFFGKSETGNVRKSNQDAFFAVQFDNDIFIAAVCDGMGGAAAGNLASKTAIDILQKKFTKALSGAVDESFDYYALIRSSLNAVNDEIAEIVKKHPECEGMGTTAVLFISAGNKIFIANVGDSRCYKCTDSELFRLTKDHSFVQYLIDSGKITEKDAQNHPNKNIITRSLGGSSSVDCEPDFFGTDKNGKLLLCSDGLTNYVSEDTICKLMTENAPKEAVEMLIDEAIKSGGGDNVTAVIADFSKQGN